MGPPKVYIFRGFFLVAITLVSKGGKKNLYKFPWVLGGAKMQNSTLASHGFLGLNTMWGLVVGWIPRSERCSVGECCEDFSDFLHILEVSMVIILIIEYQ